MATAMKTAKKNRVYISKTTNLHVYHAFLYISQLSLPDCDMKLPNFMCPLYGEGWTKHNIFPFFFLNFDMVLSDSTPENFANIWQIKWNSVGSMKFETVQIHFLRDIFGLSSSRNSAIMATWCNDFSSLSREKVRMCNQMVVGETEIIRIWTKNKWYCFLISWAYHIPFWLYSKMMGAK